jgi:hypothetical protein
MTAPHCYEKTQVTAPIVYSSPTTSAQVRALLLRGLVPPVRTGLHRTLSEAEWWNAGHIEDARGRNPSSKDEKDREPNPKVSVLSAGKHLVAPTCRAVRQQLQ